MVVPAVETWNWIRTHVRVITLALLALCTSTLLLLAIAITITGTDTTFSRSLSRGGGLLGGRLVVVVIRSSTKGICKGIIPHPPLSSCTANIDQMMIILSIIIPRIHHHHTHPSTRRTSSRRRRSRSRRNQIPMHIQLRSHRRPINRLLLMSTISIIIPIHTLRNRRLIEHIIIMTFKAETHLTPLVEVESEGVVLVEYIP
mmetsp:Transcript_25056/g.37919  ORF Transcript_25056/g.37919 Transcript_25056/m.37919 type:complete len:201 (-) Transcript_25056:582-1184(-)